MDTNNINYNVMKELKALSLGKKMKKGELKNVLGGTGGWNNNSGPGAGCRCQCDGGGEMWIQYYMSCGTSTTIYTSRCYNETSGNSATCTNDVH